LKRGAGLLRKSISCPVEERDSDARRSCMGSTTYTLLQTRAELREVADVISSLRSVSHIEYFIVKYADESAEAGISDIS